MDLKPISCWKLRETTQW